MMILLKLCALSIFATKIQGFEEENTPMLANGEAGSNDTDSVDFSSYLRIHYPRPWTNPDERGSGDLLMSAGLRSGLEPNSWPNKTIPFLFKNLQTKGIAIMRTVFQIYHKKTCIRFRPRRPTDKYYIVIDGNSSMCISNVGRQNGEQVVSLSNKYCFRTIGTPFHELMHILGFDHEHSRNDRDEHVVVNKENVVPDSIDNFEKVPGSNFDVPYDFGSVMHYSLFAFGKNRSVPTILPVKRLKKSIVVGQRNGPSNLDLLKIRRMYNCTE